MKPTANETYDMNFEFGTGALNGLVARIVAIVLIAGGLYACTAMGAAPNLTLDCSAQASAINQAAAQVGKLQVAERAAIDGDIAVSKPICTPPLPVDQAAASKQVQAGTAHILAILAVSQLRK